MFRFQIQTTRTLNLEMGEQTREQIELMLRGEDPHFYDHQGIAVHEGSQTTVTQRLADMFYQIHRIPGLEWFERAIIAHSNIDFHGEESRQRTPLNPPSGVFENAYPTCDRWLSVTLRSVLWWVLDSVIVTNNSIAHFSKSRIVRELEPMILVLVSLVGIEPFISLCKGP